VKSVGHVVAPRGLRLFVSQVRPHGDQLAISVSVQCAGGPRALHSTFAGSILLRFEEVEGRWTTTEVLSRAIT
jgi:hypothetical protein